ncbi:uncharacterized protein N7482_007227 [Penicillium canariense]|uniref:G-patch domain-containing protein n=1 Tax=Penicillium canariense TaxID=189055 RepID=A0A9W9HWG9_9EURO|nr:uncharacterized protein N7482_007227 [Penicillium canariense]KAJ5160223.1 hypothetical protein N7482_007227 [Penicillium canariense]
MPPPVEDGEDYYLPLQDQRVFGAGIRRKRVPFVRSSEHELQTINPTRPLSTPSGPNIADTYLSIVLKKQPPSASPTTPPKQEPSPPARTTHSAPPTSEAISPPPPAPTSPPQRHGHCEICNLPLASEYGSGTDSDTPSSRPHEASLAHQVCLQHSHPPSHLDRTRAGLRYLSSYGWDPDSRLGLGAAGREGIREPLKGRIKHDTAGLGTGLDADGDRIAAPPPPKKVQKLNAKQARKGWAEERRRGEKMRNLFFQSDEVLKYLGEDA